MQENRENRVLQLRALSEAENFFPDGAFHRSLRISEPAKQNGTSDGRSRKAVPTVWVQVKRLLCSPLASDIAADNLPFHT